MFELGDTFAGSGGAGGDYGWDRLGARGEQDDQPPNWRKGQVFIGSKRQGAPTGWPLDKSLCGIPTLFAWSLAYGRNLLRPERTTEPWRIRNLIVWARPNPPVGALGDKFRPATSYLTVATKSRTRWFDLDAVRTPHTEPDHLQRVGNKAHLAHREQGGDWSRGPDALIRQNPAGAPPLDYWVIPTEPYKGSHYATFPSDLCTIPIEAMCPRRVCRVCGEPSRRIVETEGHGLRVHAKANGRDDRNDWNAERPTTTTTTTLGWTDCSHDDWRNGCVLDPFAGSGTTLAVAIGHGRDAIGIDLDGRNAELARERVGMWLAVEELLMGASQ